MALVASATSPARGPLRRRWWCWTGAAGLVLLLVPVAALLVADRYPDPVFQGFWWTPLASVPTSTLPVGSIGVDVLLATALVALVARVLRGRWTVPGLVAVPLTMLLAIGTGAAWNAAAAPHVDASASLMRAVTLRPGALPPPTSAQARRAIVLGLAQPLAQGDHVVVRRLDAVPAGPWIVQTTDVLDERAEDEGADVTFETLVDPADGRILAAWFYGL